MSHFLALIDIRYTRKIVLKGKRVFKRNRVQDSKIEQRKEIERFIGFLSFSNSTSEWLYF
jgi:hypothetical protein